MLVLGQTLWIILILCTDSFLPKGCEAAIENKQMKMEDKEIPHKFASNAKRRLLWRDTTDYTNYTEFRTHSDNTYIIFIAVFVVIVLLAAMIKCCMKLAEEGDDTDAYNTNPTLHPPPRNHFIPPQRTLAPPMSNSRSLILLPEEGIFQPFHIGIENPSYVPTNPVADPTPSYASIQPKTSNHPTNLPDLPPPSYETVLIEDMLNDAGGRIANVAAAQNNSESVVLPKYEDSRY